MTEIAWQSCVCVCVCVCVCACVWQTDPNSNFLRAARAGNLETLIAFIDDGTNIDACNSVNIRSSLPLSVSFSLRGILFWSAAVSAIDRNSPAFSRGCFLPHYSGVGVTVQIMEEGGVCLRCNSLWGTKVCRYNWHGAGSLGWPFPMLKHLNIVFK